MITGKDRAERRQDELVPGNAVVRSQSTTTVAYAFEQHQQGAQGAGASEGFLAESESSGVRGVAAGSEPPILTRFELCSSTDMLGRGVPP